MDEAWEEFTVSGKIDDYLKYRSMGTTSGEGRSREREERPDGTEYSSDRDGLKCYADWRL